MLNRETGRYEGYIYCITNILNNKKYIGQTIQRPNHRWNHHRCATGRKNVDTYIDRAIVKYGEDNFKFEIIETVNRDTKEELSIVLDKLEIEYINKYHSLWSDNGYNVSSGGQGYGIDRVSTKNKVDIYDINGTLLYIANSMTEAADYVGCDTKMVSNICRGKGHNYKRKYVFRKHLEPFDKYDIYHKGYKQVDVFDNNWNYIETVMSINATARKYCNSTWNDDPIINRCKGVITSPYKGKYYFKYAS